jgi:hypothetical protein
MADPRRARGLPRSAPRPTHAAVTSPDTSSRHSGQALEPVPLARMAHLTLCAFESALSAAGRNGAAPAADVVWTLGRLAAVAPHTALRCPHVKAAMDPVDVATAYALAGARPATPPAPPAPDTADSVLGTAEAARALGISGQAVRRAAARGTLRGQHDRITGAWVFTRAAVAEYGRAHAERR